MMKNDRIQVVGSEQQAKFIQDRITSVEKHFGELCSSFGAYARKTARLRDKGDELSNIIRGYAASETVNKSLSAGLLNVSTTLFAIEEYRNAEVQRIETKVIGEFSQYEVICKHAREELKHTMTVRDREVSRKKVLERARERHPFNRQQITYAESELLKASADMSRTAKTLSEQTDFFEKRKLQQLKDILKDFIKIEMSFHCKALELLTVAHQQVAAIDEKADLEFIHSGLSPKGKDEKNFRKKMKSPEKTQKSDIQHNSGSLASLLTHHTRTPSEHSLASSDSNDSDETEDTQSSSEDHK